MGAAVNYVHHGNGQRARVWTTEIFVEWNLQVGCGSACVRQRDGKQSICSQVSFCLRAIEVYEGLINLGLIQSIKAFYGRGNYFINVANSLQNSFTAIAFLVAVAQFDGFMFACGSA